MPKLIAKTVFFFLSVLVCTFVLSYAWEHGWEAIISNLLNLPYDEDFEDAERWRFIITSIGFSAMSLLGPTVLMHILLAKLGKSNSELASSRETALSLAFKDPLTGLPNRRSLTEALAKISENDPRSGKVHTLMLMDLDRFKSINDIFGHTIGDALLSKVGARLTAITCDAVPVMLVCRLGGDEFAFLAENLDLADVEPLARQIEKALIAPFSISGREHHIGASIGIACMPDHGNSPDDLMRRADIALYQAKKNAASKIQVFEPDQERIEQERSEAGEALKHALDSGHIVPYFQPIVDLHTGETVGFEALARWVDGSHVIPPSFFIPLAEELSLINDVTIAILERALREASTWPVYLGVSVNLSPVLLRKSGLALKIQSMLLASGLSPTRLTIEITENMRLEDMPLASETFRFLHEIGVKLAIDDFGTGFASIHHLKELRFDSLKLDKSYVAALGSDAENDAIVRSTLSLARALQMQVVFEGIEDAKQANWLEAEGGGFGQGYLFAKPIAPQEVQDYLRRRCLTMAV